jgi:hypothetical protein
VSVQALVSRNDRVALGARIPARKRFHSRARVFNCEARNRQVQWKTNSRTDHTPGTPKRREILVSRA